MQLKVSGNTMSTWQTPMALFYISGNLDGQKCKNMRVIPSDPLQYVDLLSVPQVTYLSWPWMTELFPIFWVSIPLLGCYNHFSSLSFKLLLLVLSSYKTAFFIHVFIHLDDVYSLWSYLLSPTHSSFMLYILLPILVFSLGLFYTPPVLWISN